MKNIKTIAKGDRITFDFKGYINNKAFQGGAAKGYTLLIGSGDFIPGFEDQMVGIKQGESKDIFVTFPKNYHAKEFAGKESKFEVKIHSIKKPR